MNVNDAWLEAVGRILRDGDRVAPRGQMTTEVLGFQTKIDMSQPVLTLTGRDLGYKFMLAEAAWILSGDNRVSTIAAFAKDISKFSDDGQTFFGAYGPKFKQQLPYISWVLRNDPSSRQAVISLWRESPMASKDIPCTLTMQCILRDKPNTNSKYLYCIVNMRSSDIWLGAPYDWFNFSMMSLYLARYLQKYFPEEIKLGELTFNAGSCHLYDRNKEAALKCVTDAEDFDLDPMRITSFRCPVINETQFIDAQCVENHLRSLADELMWGEGINGLTSGYLCPELKGHYAKT